MDANLRELEKRARHDPEILRKFLAAAYRAGYFHPPTRVQIKDIMRGQTRRYYKVRLDPRYYYPDEGQSGRNASNLQHPSEINLWSGDYGTWQDALTDALPGEIFEVNVYNWHDGNWDFSHTTFLEIPELVLFFNGAYYSQPPEFKLYHSSKLPQLPPPKLRRNPEAKFSYLGQCDKLRRTECNEALWQIMMRNAVLISLEDFENLCHMETLLDEDESLSDFISGDLSSGFYTSRWGNKKCAFIQTHGFEFIFIEDYQRNPDENILRLERLAYSGDLQAGIKLVEARKRVNLPVAKPGEVVLLHNNKWDWKLAVVHHVRPNLELAAILEAKVYCSFMLKDRLTTPFNIMREDVSLIKAIVGYEPQVKFMDWRQWITSPISSEVLERWTNYVVD